MVGQVILLSGPSSAGKAALALALQTRLNSSTESWVFLGVADYVVKAGASSLDALAPRVRQAFRAAVAGATRAGVNVVVDDGELDDEAMTRWQQNLRRVHVTQIDPTEAPVDEQVEAVCALLDERQGGE